MTKLKTTLAGLALAVGIAAPIAIQHNANNKLETNQTELTQLQSELNALRDDNETLRNRQRIEAAEQARIEAERLELLKLRGEVGSLRRLVEEQANQLAANEVEVPEEELQEEEEWEPVTSYVATAEEDVQLGQTLVTGGWELAPGLHAYIMITPEIVQGEDGSSVINAKVKILGLRDDRLVGLGLPQFPVGTTEISFSGTTDTQEFYTRLEDVQGLLGVDIIASPSVTTRDGVQAYVEMKEEIIVPNGAFKEFSDSMRLDDNGNLILPVGPSVDIIPTISPDGSSINVVAIASWLQLNKPIE